VSSYIDSSAALKLVVEERESEALVRWLDEHPEIVGTLLVETEVRRAARRMAVPQSVVNEMLEGVTLHDVTPGTFREAGALPGDHLRSLDALHLAAALRLGCRTVVTYDGRMAEAARELGFDVVAPVA
jgi:predicted nucleic acid-binding protein